MEFKKQKYKMTYFPPNVFSHICDYAGESYKQRFNKVIQHIEYFPEGWVTEYWQRTSILTYTTIIGMIENTVLNSFRKLNYWIDDTGQFNEQYGLESMVQDNHVWKLNYNKLKTKEKMMEKYG